MKHHSMRIAVAWSLLAFALGCEGSPRKSGRTNISSNGAGAGGSAGAGGRAGSGGASASDAAIDARAPDATAVDVAISTDVAGPKDAATAIDATVDAAIAADATIPRDVVVPRDVPRDLVIPADVSDARDVAVPRDLAPDSAPDLSGADLRPDTAPDSRDACVPSCGGRTCGAGDGCGSICTGSTCLCPSNTHRCSGSDACVANDINACGPNCTTCPAPPPNALATCDGTSCGTTCKPNFTACGGQCADTSNDPLNCGACGHGCQGAACVASLCQPVTLATATGSLARIALDATSVYWGALNLASGKGSVLKCGLGGCGGTGSVVASNLDGGIFGLAIGGDSAFIAAGAFGTSVLKCAVGGCPGGPTAFPSSDGQPVASVALDATSVFWTLYPNAAAQPPLPDAVMSCPMSGCPPAGPTTLAAVTLSPAANQSIGRIVVAGAKVVFATVYGGTEAVMSCPIAGGCGSSPAIVHASTDMVGPLAVDPTGTHVYWSSGSPNSLLTCPVAGCPSSGPTTVYSYVTGGVYDVAVDATNVYWTDAFTLKRCAVGGCNQQPTILARLPPPENTTFSDLALDAGNIYWLDHGFNSGRVVKLAK